LRLSSRCGRSSRRAITVVEACVLTAVALALGLFLLLVANIWAQNSFLSTTEETDINIAVIRSFVVIEFVSYDDDGRVSLVLRNVSEDEVDVIISKVELRSLETSKIFYSRDLLGDNIVLRRGESYTVSGLPTCEDLEDPMLQEECKSTVRLAYRAYYMPLRIYGKGYRLSTTETPTGDSVIMNPSVRLECLLPEEGWVLLDLVDPVTLVSSGDLYADPSTHKGRVWIEAPLASGVDTITVQAVVSRIGGSGTASGSASIKVPEPAQQYYIALSGKVSQIYVPFKVTLSSPSKRIIPGEWIFGGQRNVAHVSGLLLSWRTEDKLVDSIIAEVGFGSLGTYRVSITLKDCNGKIIATGSNTVTASASTKASIPIELSNPVRLDQIYYVESGVGKIG